MLSIPSPAPSPSTPARPSSTSSATAPRRLDPGHAVSRGWSAAPDLSQLSRSTVIGTGHAGSSVQDLQGALNAAGAQPPLVQDGLYGPRTEAVVRRFQAQHGLAVDGIVGPQTLQALRGGGSLEPARMTQQRTASSNLIGAAPATTFAPRDGSGAQLQTSHLRRGLPAAEPETQAAPTASAAQPPAYDVIRSGSAQSISRRQAEAINAHNVERSGLVGYVPRDGARYGIRTGSAQEWTDYFNRQMLTESSHTASTIRINDDYRERNGQISSGLFSMSVGERGLTATSIYNPVENSRAAIETSARLIRRDGVIAERSASGRWLGASAYFGPLRRGAVAID